MTPAATPSATPAPIVRRFGRFELRRLLGKSARAMVWLAFDATSGAEVMLTLPRVQPEGAFAADEWLRGVRAAGRLDHPNLAAVGEVGIQDHWPFIAVDRSLGVTLGEWLATRPRTVPAELVGLFCQLLRGLAFAHEAGVVHRDLQLHSVLVGERGQVRLMGLATASVAGAAPGLPSQSGSDAPATVAGTATTITNGSLTMAPSGLQVQRHAAAHELLACGLLLHHLLAGRAALDQTDTALAIDRMTPLGHEIVRLPWTTPVPVPEALRAIANRCTSAQERLRYTATRTLLRALDGWLEAQADADGGPLGVLLDRLRSIGHLPALPGLAARVARITGLEGQSTEELADQVLEDVALSFELLRTLNTAQVQGTQVQGNGPVLTLRRVVALIGLNGVRGAANSLRQWPGPLAPQQADALLTTLQNVRLAACLAQALRPAGYDAQVVYLICVLQNLGRLMLAYHFADEAEQVRQLMRAQPADTSSGRAEQPGLSERAAAYAVLGVDIEALGAVVAHTWSLGDEVLQMARRVPPDAPVRKPVTDDDMLRVTASAANDCVDALSGLPAARSGAALGQLAQRYGRALGLGVREFAEGLAQAREALARTRATPVPRGRAREGEGHPGLDPVDANPATSLHGHAPSPAAPDGVWPEPVHLTPDRQAATARH
jgi:eukaryotic-like serine/threonine-protein kinase